MATLIIKASTGQPATVVLPETGTLTGGRSTDNAVVLPDARCSRRHFTLERDAGGVIITDLGSSNGTLLNGVRLAAPARLKHGDVISAGEVDVLFLDDGAEVPQFGQAPAPDDEVIVRSVEEIAQALDGGVRSAAIGYAKGADPYSTNTAVGATGGGAFAVLVQLSRIILGSTSSQELIDSAVDLLFQVLPAQRVAIFLLDEEQHPLLSAHRSVTGDEAFTVSSTILERAVRERVAISSGDARHDPRFSSGVSIATWDIRSVLGVPLWADGEVHGVLYLDNPKQQYAFGESDLELATGVANMVAVGLKQHQLKERIKTEAVVRSNLERYHSPDVVNLIIKRRGLEDSLQAATETTATILFSDIKGFTPLSERLRPAELAELLNWYFDLMTRIIFKHHGSVNKFIGDAIMAIFGAPIAQGDDPALAVRAAAEMLAALDDFNAHLDERKRFQIRIGINTGPVIAGDIGARNRMEYTVIGDAVNTAQRLESVCRPNAVTVGEGTYQHVRDKFKFNALGKLELKGKAFGVQAYELIV